MLASFGVFSVLSCKPSESCVMCLAQQSVFFFLCSACQLHITFDFPCLQADCRHHLVLSASFSFPFVTQKRQQILPSPWDSSLVSHIFSSVTCSLKGLLVSLGGSSVYFWLSHSFHTVMLSVHCRCRRWISAQGRPWVRRPRETPKHQLLVSF